jgi:glycosyltransferase involved in cell wall biosynthesis
MKLLTLLPSEIRGGAEEYALTIATAAAQLGWNVHAAFPKTDKTTSLIRDFLANNVHYHSLKIAETNNSNLGTKKRHALRFARTLKLLLTLKPDLVNITLPWPNYCLGSIIACGLLKVPTAVVFQLVPHKFSFSKKILNAYTWARTRNQKWIAVSEFNRQVVCESFEAQPSEVITIYNGTKVFSEIDRTLEEDETILRHQICEELGISSTSRIALTVGRLSEHKGYADIIPTIPHITQEFPDVRFVWVGEGEEKEQLVRKIKEYGIEGKVLFLGYRSDVQKLLKAADLFVFPTHFEGLPFALIESMAHGLPIIASDATSIPEIIENKLQGLLFRTGDSCELLETLRWALRHPEKIKKMAENAKLRAQDFSEAKMVKETLEVLDNLAQTST